MTNALDNLTGSHDLISVRNRGSFSRPFTLVRAIQQEAEMQFRQKEQALQQRLKETERKIQELQSRKEDQTTVILSTEQEAALDGFRQELVATRKELRNVQHELQKKHRKSRKRREVSQHRTHAPGDRRRRRGIQRLHHASPSPWQLDTDEL